jgi:RNA polymerase sigma factor (sigma-70 family)
MLILTDSQLLQSFSSERSQSAFRQLVDRYANLVYSAARRQVSDAETAQDVTQAVFIILAQKAGILSEKTVLSGWLVCTAHYAAQNAMKMRARRVRHEQKAAAMRNECSPPSHTDANDLLPHLDDALARLAEKDRHVIVLRFLQQLSISEISTAVGISPDAAQKRISRALQKLQRIFARDGLAFSTSAMAFIPLHTAPHNLASAVLSALASQSVAGATSISIAHGAMRMMTWIKLQFAGAVAASVVITGGIGTIVIHQAITRAATHAVRIAPVAGVAPALPGNSSDPRDTLRQIDTAWATGNSELYNQTHLPGTADENAFSAALAHMISSRTKLLAAYHAINPSDALLRYRDILQLGDVIPRERIDAAAVTNIDDHTVDVAIPNSMTYRLILVGGQWRFSVQPTVGSMYPSDPAKATKLMANRFEQDDAALNTATKALASATPEAARTILGFLAVKLTLIMNNSTAVLPPAAFTVLPNATFSDLSTGDPGYTCKADPSVKHFDVPPMLLTSTTATVHQDGQVYRLLDPQPYLGKRVRFSAYFKTLDVPYWGGLGMIVVAPDGKWFASDYSMMQSVGHPHHVTGTTDWKQLQIVEDVPPNTARIWIGMDLQGRGKLWFDDARIEPVGKEVPTTDSQNLQLRSIYSNNYSLDVDAAVQRNGHSVLCMTPHNPPRGAHCWIGQDNRHVDTMRGHQMRATVWMKAQNNTSRAFMNLVDGEPGNRIGGKEFDDRAGQPFFRLSTEWKKYEITGTTPLEAHIIEHGIFILGPGKVWIDDFKMEDMEAYDQP